MILMSCLFRRNNVNWKHCTVAEFELNFDEVSQCLLAITV